jgi:SNF2 family DNA or RNA helicase
MVLDEAHYTKNFDAKRTRNIFRHLAPVCERILPMSATPMTRDAADLYAPLRYMKPEAIADRHGHLMTLHAFQDAFCHVEQRRFNGRTVRVVTGSRNLAELRSRMGSFFMRLTKKECLPELPPMQFEILPIGIDRDVQTALAEAVGDIDVAKVDPEVAEFDAHISRAMREIGVAKARPAAQWVKDFLEGTNEKVVLWARHHDVIDALARELAHANPAIIDGRVDQKGRAAAVESFLTDDACRVFIGQIASAGTGLTLLTDKVQPRTVLFVDSSWSPSENYQAASRVHRLGQRDGVIVYSLVAQGVPLDRHIQTVLTRKSLEFAEIMDREGDAVCQ